MKFSTLSSTLAVSTLLLASTGVAFAGHHVEHHNYKEDYKNEVTCPVPPMLLDGFYVGAQVGYDSYRLRHSFNNATVGSSTVGSLNGWMGGLFLGYGRYLTNLFYLGGELNGNYNGTEYATHSRYDNVSGNSVSVNSKVKGTWGLSLLPGLMLNNASLGYLRLGYNWTQFQSNASGTLASVAFSGSNNSTEGGFVFGLGLETLLYQNWSVRTEFDHTWYSSYNINNASVSPAGNEFTLGLLYHFC